MPWGEVPMFSTELKGKVLQNGRGRDSGCDVTYNYRSGKCNQNTFALAKVVYCHGNVQLN